MKKARLNIKFVKHKMIDMDIKNIKELADRLEEKTNSIKDYFQPSRKVEIPNSRKLAKMIELFDCDFNDLLEIVEVDNEPNR